jgi:predicted O-methyltransferase YrrM
MKQLFAHIAESIERNPNGWTSIEKASAISAAILTLRPEFSVEIGVYAGKGLIPMALTHQALNSGKVIGIDPWSPVESAAGQVHPADVKWWSQLDHEVVYNACLATIEQYKLNDFVQIQRTTSDKAELPPEIGVLRIDGNHGEQAMKDVQRYCPKVNRGGILFLDDLNWSGGAVGMAARWLDQNGWRRLYALEDGLVFQRS